MSKKTVPKEWMKADYWMDPANIDFEKVLFTTQYDAEGVLYISDIMIIVENQSYIGRFNVNTRKMSVGDLQNDESVSPYTMGPAEAEKVQQYYETQFFNMLGKLVIRYVKGETS